MAEQVDRVVKKAHCVLAFIAWGIEYKNLEIIMQLCKTLVKPHSEQMHAVWSPNYRKDVKALESVQRLTRMLHGLEGFSNKMRLNRLGLFSLERQRQRG